METTAIETTQDTRQKLMEIIKQYVLPEVDMSKVTDSSDFIGDLQVNSTRFVDIILDMEDKFGIMIDEKTADGMLTIGDAIAIVEKQKTM